MRTLLSLLFAGLSLLLPAQVLPDTLPTADAADKYQATVPSYTQPIDSYSRHLAARLDSLCTTDPLLQTTQLGLYVYDLTADRPVYAHGEHQRLRPGSCQKVVTAITALSRLGTGYQLTTRLSMDAAGNDPATADSILHTDLYLVGGFDPLFSAEDLRALLVPLTERGIDSIAADIYLDLSMTDTLRLGWGWCWDDDNPILTPQLLEGRPLRTTDLTLALRDVGIGFSGRIRPGRCPDAVTTIGERRHSIDQILLPMMKQSDNLMAEALFAHIAAAGNRRQATRRHAATAVRELLTRLHVDPSGYQVADGSGLSLYNYATPHQLVTLLRYAYTDESLRRHLLPSLPVAGTDGTLRRRMRTTPVADNVVAKTGTLEGISTLAGYLTTAKGHVLAFAIMNQGVRRTAHGHRFQDRVCEILCGSR